jgi:hypothetical protein
MPSPNSLRNLKPWPPGCSGNAGGRPKASLEVRALAREHTAEALNTIVEIMRSARSDSVKLAAAEAILDRGWGRPAQEITGPGEGPIQVEAMRLAAEQFRERVLRLAAGVDGVAEPPEFSGS